MFGFVLDRPNISYFKLKRLPSRISDAASLTTAGDNLFYSYFSDEHDTIDH